jgi:hypothetical protein
MTILKNVIKYKTIYGEANTDPCCSLDFIHMTLEAVTTINVRAETV